MSSELQEVIEDYEGPEHEDDLEFEQLVGMTREEFDNLDEYEQNTILFEARDDEVRELDFHD